MPKPQNLISFPLRVPAPQKKAFKDLAKKDAKAAGKPITASDLGRDALTEYLDRRNPPKQ